jgi:hypothetical protein
MLRLALNRRSHRSPEPFPAIGPQFNFLPFTKNVSSGAITQRLVQLVHMMLDASPGVRNGDDRHGHGERARMRRRPEWRGVMCDV